MRIFLITIMCTIAYIPAALQAQNNQTVISVESRLGYTTNTYLNPFSGDWDPSLNTGYGVLNSFAHTSFYNRHNILDLTGGLVLEPFMDGRTSWKGGLGLLSYKRRLSPEWNLGMETGGSYFTGTYDRSSVWVQPFVTWLPSFFTSLRLKAGSNFQGYTNFIEGQESSDRFDIYGLEFETWPNYNWQLKANMYGSLDVLPSLQEQVSLDISVGRLLEKSAKITLNAGFEQYQFETTTSTSGPGGPPIGGPGGGTVTTTNSDRILSLGLSGSMPLNKTFSVFATAEGIQRYNTVTNESVQDIQLSGGVRMLFNPRFNRADNQITPVLEQDQGEPVYLEIRYFGEGRLYLIGDFNDWNQAGYALIENSKNTYSIELELEPGTYEYKVQLRKGSSKEWLEFSNEVYTVEDGFGGENAMIFVE